MAIKILKSVTVHEAVVLRFLVGCRENLYGSHFTRGSLSGRTRSHIEFLISGRSIFGRRLICMPKKGRLIVVHRRLHQLHPDFASRLKSRLQRVSALQGCDPSPCPGNAPAARETRWRGILLLFALRGRGIRGGSAKLVRDGSKWEPTSRLPPIRNAMEQGTAHYVQFPFQRTRLWNWHP